LQLNSADYAKNLSVELGCSVNEVKDDIFRVDSTAPTGLDMKGLLEKDADWRIASTNADYTSMTGLALLMRTVDCNPPFKGVGNHWPTLLLGGRGHFYFNVGLKKVYRSFGFKGHCAFVIGPYEPVVKIDPEGGKERHFYLATEVEKKAIAPVWLFDVDKPEGAGGRLKDHQWVAFTTEVRLPHEMAKFGLGSVGLVEEHVGDHNDLLTYHLLNGLTLNLPDLQKFTEKFGLKPKVIPPEKGITKAAHLVQLIKFVFMQSSPDAQFVIYKQYEQIRGAYKKDILKDTPSDFKRILSTMDPDDAKRFHKIQEGLEQQQLDDIVSMRLESIKTQDALRKDPEAATPLVYRTLKPPVQHPSVCRLCKDYGNRGFQTYYKFPGGKETSGSFSFMKKRPETLALYEAVDWLWEHHRAAGHDVTNKPSISQCDEALAAGRSDEQHYKDEKTKWLEKAFKTGTYCSQGRQEQTLPPTGQGAHCSVCLQRQCERCPA